MPKKNDDDLSWLDDALDRAIKQGRPSESIPSSAPANAKVPTTPQPQLSPLEVQRFNIEGGYGGVGKMQPPEDLQLSLGYKLRF